MKQRMDSQEEHAAPEVEEVQPGLNNALKETGEMPILPPTAPLRQKFWNPSTPGCRVAYTVASRFTRRLKVTRFKTWWPRHSMNILQRHDKKES